MNKILTQVQALYVISFLRKEDNMWRELSLNLLYGIISRNRAAAHSLSTIYKENCSIKFSWKVLRIAIKINIG